MLLHHTDVKVRFDQQVENSANYVLPFIERTHPVKAGMHIMEVGCAEGGVLKPFLERGCHCVGVDLAPERIGYATELLGAYVGNGQLTLLCQNIYDQEFLDRFRGKFDVIMLKDVIEHVPEQTKFIPYLKNFLAPGGQIFFGFPPWHMPFGGHQQICESKLASKMPYYHILPRGIYKGLLRAMGESDYTVNNLLEVWDTSITIGQFERYVRNAGLKVLAKQHYLINPIYKYKFGLKPRKQLGLIGHIPFLRNFVTTCVYYTVGL